MILTEVKRDIESTLTGESKRFTIQASGKAFDILVAGIYSDKIASIIREILSNAYDAHVRAGNQSNPFEVRLPNSLNPTFSVRDYGCSMDHETVMGLYSTLFGSSKTDTNTEVGQFGLGAKSVFAYTDAFTIVCWLDGEKRTYSVARDQDSIPAVTLVHTAPSTEGTGVEVTFAVKSQDFRDFSNKYGTIALGFDVAPKVLGSDFSTPKPEFIGNGWRVFKSANIGGDKVRQGCAIYPYGGGYPNLPHMYEMILDVPIGRANVTASRESLALTREQNQWISEKRSAAIKELNLQVQNNYYALPTALERAWFAYRNQSLMGNGTFPLSVKLTKGLTNWTADAVYADFRVDRIARVMIVRNDGTQLVRKQRRLKALSNRFDLYIVDDPAVIAEARVLLGLGRDQVINMVDVPDVYVAPRAVKPRVKKSPAMNRVWAISNRGSCEAGDRCWNRNKQSLLGLNHKSSSLLEGHVKSTHALDPVAGEAILYLTERESEAAIKSGKINPKLRLDIVAKALAENYRQAAQYTAFVAGISDSCHSSFLQKMILERTGRTPKGSLPSDAMELFLAFFDEDWRDQVQKGRDETRKFAVAYPLLFGSNDQGAVTDYIKVMDERRAAQV